MERSEEKRRAGWDEERSEQREIVWEKEAVVGTVCFGMFCWLLSVCLAACADHRWAPSLTGSAGSGRGGACTRFGSDMISDDDSSWSSWLIRGEKQIGAEEAMDVRLKRCTVAAVQLTGLTDGSRCCCLLINTHTHTQFVNWPLTYLGRPFVAHRWQ